MGALVVVRNLAPILTIAIESSFTGEAIEFDRPSVLSLLLIIGGVVLYVQHDVAFSPVGVGFMVANMCFGIFERMLQRRMIAVEPIDVSKTGMMLLNNGVRDMRRDRARDRARSRRDASSRVQVAMFPTALLAYALGELDKLELLSHLDTR